MRKLLMVSALLFGFAGSAFGERPDVDLYGQLAALRAENVLLTEKLKNTELKSQIESREGKSFAAVTATNAAVQMVSGSAGNLTALIALPNNSHVLARVGTQIQGVGVVKSISANEVVVSGKAGPISLPFASESGGGMSLNTTITDPFMPQPQLPSGPVKPPPVTTPPPSSPPPSAPPPPQGNVPVVGGR
jgi:hypothetical protein